MTVETRVLDLLPGTTDQVCDRYVITHLKDSDHGTPESYRTVYGALTRLHRKGAVTKEKVFGGKGSYTVYWSES